MYRRYLIVPDNFKNILGADEICEILSESILALHPDAEIRALPMNGGGHGMANAYLHIMGGREERILVTGPEGSPVEAVYGILPDRTGVAEMSTAAGLSLVKNKNNPLTATSRGVGELLVAMERAGAKRIILGLGESATNDCGIGMAHVLGWRFYDAYGSEVEPVAANLSRIDKVVQAEKVLNIPVMASCKVDNPLWGPEGTTYAFGEQKGASSEMIETLEKGVRHFSNMLSRCLGKSVSALRGSGAAGGMGATIAALMKGELRPGIEMLLDTAKMNELLQNTDIVITGDTFIDGTCTTGKVPSGISSRAKDYDLPCIAFCAHLGRGYENLYDYGITSMFRIINENMNFSSEEEQLNYVRKSLRMTADNVFRVLDI